MPNFAECYVCGKMFTPRSLEFHEPTCLQLWHVENAKLPPIQRRPSPRKPGPITQSETMHPPTVMLKEGGQYQAFSQPPKSSSLFRRTISRQNPRLLSQQQTFQSQPDLCNGSRQMTSSPLKSLQLHQNRLLFGSKDETYLLKRPSTVTINGRSSSSDQRPAPFRSGSLPSYQENGELHENQNQRGSPNTRVCYICGQRIGRCSIEMHEKKCIAFWRVQIQHLPNFMKVKQEPHKLTPPSLDGTIDVERLDILASESSQKAQKVDCSKCKKSVSLVGAKEHLRNCSRAAENSKKSRQRSPPVTHYCIGYYK